MASLDESTQPVDNDLDALGPDLVDRVLIGGLFNVHEVEHLRAWLDVAIVLGDEVLSQVLEDDPFDWLVQGGHWSVPEAGSPD